MRKPRLTVEQARWFVKVDEAIRDRSWPHSFLGVMQLFSDLFDGALYEREVAPLVRQGLLRWSPLEPCDRREGDLLGRTRTVDLTERAIALFWPAWAIRPRTNCN